MTAGQSLRIGIIGAGVAGLASAALLAREGHRVTVLERADAVGGRAGTWREGGFTFDTGPSWWLMPECFEHFFTLLGERLEDHLELVPLDPAYRVFGEGADEPLDVRSGRERAIALFDSVEPGAGARLADYLDSAAQTYDMATRRFLYTTFSRIPPAALVELLPQVPRLARLLLESLHGKAARTVQDRRLQQILGYPAVFLAATPRTAPSLYHLMSAMDLADAVRYPLGGFTRFVEVLARLAQEQGARLRTGVEVTRIRTASRGPLRRPLVTGLELRRADGTEEQLDLDLVVSAADLHHTETVLLPPELRGGAERRWAATTSGPGAVLALLGVESPLPQLAHHSLFFTEDWDRTFSEIFDGAPAVPDPASLYVCRPSATDPGTAPRGMENLFILIPVSPDAPAQVGAPPEEQASIGAGGVDGAGDARVEAAVDRAIAQISDWAQIPDLSSRIRVRRTIGPADFARDFHAWRGNALGPAHTRGQSAFLRGSNRSRRADGLLFAGATSVPGVGVPMCLISAENVLKRVRGDRSDGPLPA